MNKILYKLLFLVVLGNTCNSYSQGTSRNPNTSPIEECPDFYWYFDYDKDGFGDPLASYPGCDQPTGYVANNEDCDDNNEFVTVASIWYFDNDNDGFGDPAVSLSACTQPNKYTNNKTDCDDNNQDINPNTKWYLDTNGDGIGSELDGIPLLSCTKPVGNYLNALIDPSSHWIHQAFYDAKGNTTQSSRTYFDDLAKSTVSLSKDFVGNKIWGIETTYDDFGRPDKTSFTSPSPLNTFAKTNFLKSSTQAQTELYPTTLTLTTITADKDHKATESILITGTVSPGLTVTLTAPSIIFKDIFTIKATAGSSFIATAAILPDVSSNASLANYYSDNNTDELYQATATHAFAQNNYDGLNPGNIINTVGGNKINGEWKTGYTYTVPAAQEMYYVYGTDYYDGPTVSGKEEVITKFYKSVSVDANGIENVSFTDGEGKILATARSGGNATYPVISLIGTQGFVDVHIPAGITSGISLLGSPSLYKIYDLKTGLSTTTLTGGNAYRIEAIIPPLTDPKTYISVGQPTYDVGALGISYNVNYYDYAVNIYNKTSQLIKSVQPNGYTANSTIIGTPVHMNSTNFTKTYKYNTLGQIIEVSSPDEGISKFIHRKDGQIRYSQSALQKDTKVSYTDYDNLGRPKESGVIANNWAAASIDPDSSLITGERTEQAFTVYDDSTNNETSVQLPTAPINLTLAGVLSQAGINVSNYVQNNLSGNVAITYTKSGATISTITWYSYDIYGRSEWVVQYNEGIGAKTIHYEYDYKDNVKKVLFQKDKVAELFVHQYTYSKNDVLTKVETSVDNSTFVTHADYSYYKTGELKRINIAQGVQGLDYVYTLGGQLKSINHPSLEAAKDPGKDTNDVFGLTLDYYKADYLRSNRNIISSPTAGSDYNGNIKAARWANKGVPGDYSSTTANQKGYLYNYDRNNWLTAATFGNTNSATAVINPTANLAEQELTYDANGNIKRLVRTNDIGTIVDNLTYNYDNTKNQLSNLYDAVTTADATDIENQAPNNYQYNSIGQMIRNNAENIEYTYNSTGLVTQVKKGTQITVNFSYNERGQRVKKQTISNLGIGNIRTDTDYYILDLSGNVMSNYYSLSGTTVTPKAIYQKEIPIFGLSRLGVYTKAVGKENDIISYEITDHLGNVRAVIEKENNVPKIKSYADYYPFGEQLPSRNSFSNYRYAFQGQELDNETGMEAFQLRLWDGRIGRWISPDPYGQYSSPYLGMGNNPISMIDPDGGYSWLGAVFRWAGGGFSGSITKQSSTGEYGINYGNVGFYDSSTGEGGIKTNIDWGSDYKDIPSSGSSGGFSNSNCIPCNPLSANHNDAFGVFSNTFYDPYPNSKWDWFKNNFSGHPTWGTGGGTMELGQKLGRNGQRYNSIYTDEMVLPVGGGGGRAQNNILKFSRDLAGGYMHGEQVGKFDGTYNFKYIKYELNNATISVFDSTITEERVIIHLKGRPHNVDRQIDSLNKVYENRESIKKSYLKSWGK